MDNIPKDDNTENILPGTDSETPLEPDLSDEKAPGRLNWKYAVVGTALLVVLIVATFAFMHNASELDFGVLAALFRSSSPAFLALGFMCVLSHIYCEGRAMAAAAGGIGIKIGHVRSTLYACAELFFAAVTPSASGGQPAVAYFMYKDGIRVSRSSVILLTNTLHSTTSLLALGLVTLV
ncbi:MAG: flippase-like domain-containing protein [Clostridia bacterium]|nr:flippase-like domain-containing protein [Clostridia bacterium]